MMLVRPRDLRPGEKKVVIVDPVSRLKLPPYGGSVPNSSYWHRRLNCGDIVPTTSDAISEGKAESEAKAKHKAAAKAEAKTGPKTKSPGKGNR